MAGVRLDFFHATDFWGSEHSVEKVYEVYILFELSWSAVSMELELPVISSFVQVSPILALFCKLSGAFTGTFV